MFLLPSSSPLSRGSLEYERKCEVINVGIGVRVIRGDVEDVVDKQRTWKEWKEKERKNGCE